MKTATLSMDAAWNMLEKQLAPDDYLYLLRELYHVVLYAERHRETLQALRCRIRHIETTCALPIALSRFPISALLTKLELAQYVYPIHHREISFAYFLQSQ